MTAQPWSLSVTVVDTTPRCAHPDCGVALRLRLSLAAGICCCHRSACDVEDVYVDLVTGTAGRWRVSA